MVTGSSRRMRIVIAPHSLEMGGSQLNAVELAAQLDANGHEVVVFGAPGALVTVLERNGIEFQEAPCHPRFRPSPSVVRALIRTVQRHKADVVHGFEWPPIVEAHYGPGMLCGVPVTGTVMSMSVAPFIPPSIGLAVGTKAIARNERDRRSVVHVWEPPVDVVANSNRADVGRPEAQRRQTGDNVLVVMVCRLARELKEEGILAAVEAIGRLRREGLAIRLAIVGDGPSRAIVEAAARRVNSALNQEVVHLAGEIDDPRPWYQAADIVLGMGGSALRGMAFEKPLVVQGEMGFWVTLTPESLGQFLDHGWYGVGDGGNGVDTLSRLLRELYCSAELRADLGQFSRAVVAERFSLERAAAMQEGIYLQAIREWPSRRALLGKSGGSGAQVVAYGLRRKLARLQGGVTSDDFNALAKLTTE